MPTEKTHETVSGVEKTAQSTTDRMAQATHQAIDTLTDYGTRTEERLRETGRRAAERSREYAEDVGTYVRQRPVMALALALGAGFLLGALSRTRR
ncbi:MAG TPA: hypothetical protein VF203_13655 [Burkholderiales bacterium]